MGGTKLDKVCIYGVYEFVGFHLCKRLLEKGFCVEGIHFEQQSDEFLEEKRLEIGRNANFEETVFANGETKSESEMIILSLYDLFMTYKESYEELFPQIVQSINERSNTKSQLIYILPIQLLTNLEDIEGMKEVQNFIDQVKNSDQCIQYFYLPTIFGPWQSGTFLFQRELLNQFNHLNEKIEIREWLLDAIYIEDLLTPIMKKIESGETGSFLVESGIPKSWELCAEILKLDENIKKGFDHVKLKTDVKMKKLQLTEVTPYEKSLSDQKKHLSIISNLMIDS
jgi:hypothetical protein